ncbi:hypothetical protein A2U01_0033235, partial [Trifolium medium]|nr:hypothetical protein [Trifolium medium]
GYVVVGGESPRSGHRSCILTVVSGGFVDGFVKLMLLLRHIALRRSVKPVCVPVGLPLWTASGSSVVGDLLIMQLSHATMVMPSSFFSHFFIFFS